MVQICFKDIFCFHQCCCMLEVGFYWLSGRGGQNFESTALPQSPSKALQMLCWDEIQLYWEIWLPTVPRLAHVWLIEQDNPVLPQHWCRKHLGMASISIFQIGEKTENGTKLSERLDHCPVIFLSVSEHFLLKLIKVV